MATIKHNHYLDTIDEVLQNAKRAGMTQLYAEGSALTGRSIQIKGQSLFHFGTTGYLGLEQDHRLKEAAIAAIQNYGTQFPLSKTYLSHPLYAELEEKVQQMYGIPPIITKNSTLGHLAVIPTLIRDEDAVIMDHQVHWSVQNACQLLKLRGVSVELIRHNRLDLLEDALKRLHHKAKIWYMADGVYSMFGDFAPISALMALAQKYPQLHLYFDDVHGMSWRGVNGRGFVFDALVQLPENVVLVSTLSKTFGASGATFFCTDDKLREKIKNFGGPLTFSAQLEPSSVAAAIASASIHLSPEITLLQQELADKIAFFNATMATTSLPIVDANDSPVFFLGLATPATAYHFVKQMFDEGFYLNLGIYPAVSIKNTGVRLTLSRHNQWSDIVSLAQAMEYHFPKSVAATENSAHKIRHAFGLPLLDEPVPPDSGEDMLQLEAHRSITALPPEVWNRHIGKQNMLDFDGMRYLEDTFAHHPDETQQCDFYYYTIKDRQGKVVLMTFLTFGLWKDDMLAAASVSRQVEEIRKTQPHYLTSKVLSMGCLFTEGNQHFVADKHPLVASAWKMLLHTLEAKYNALQADLLVLRDFEIDYIWSQCIEDQGFFKIQMPESCVIKIAKGSTVNDFAATLSVRSRKHFQKEIQGVAEKYNVQIKEKLSPEELNTVFHLYKNVKDQNLALNTFTYSKSIFEQMNEHPHWEFILLSLATVDDPAVVGVMFCYKNSSHTYVPALIGMNYGVAKELHLYRQLLFQTIKRAYALKVSEIDFGVSASFEKRKLGAVVLPKVAYIQSRDNYGMELLHTLQNDSQK